MAPNPKNSTTSDSASPTPSPDARGRVSKGMSKGGRNSFRRSVSLSPTRATEGSRAASPMLVNVELSDVKVSVPPKKAQEVKGGVVDCEPVYASSCCSQTVVSPPKESPFLAPPVKTIKLRKVYLAYNPFSGTKKGTKIFNKVTPLFKKRGVEVVPLETKYAGHPIDLGKETDLDGFDAFCVIGGDGTASQVVSGMLQRKDGKMLPIGIIPGGTGNSFMTDFGLTDPVEATERLLKGEIHACDIAHVVATDKDDYDKQHDIYSLNLVSRDTVNSTAEKLRWMGPKRYDVAVFRDVMKNKPPKSRVIVDGEVLSVQDFTAIVAQVNMHCGSGLYMAPFAKLDDGYLDLITVKKTSASKSLKTFGKVKAGTHIYDDQVTYRRFKSLRLEPIDKNKPSELNIDGEVVGVEPYECTVLPSRWFVLL